MHATCSLPAELTVYTLGEVFPQCLAWIAEDARSTDKPITEEYLRVGAEAVAEVDAAGVQLLLSLANSLMRQHRKLCLVRPSVPLAAACRALGAGALMANAELAEATT